MSGVLENDSLFALFKAVEANRKAGVLIENYIEEHQVVLDDDTRKLLNDCLNEALARD